ncbi:MAG: paar repeat-containing protein [Pseudomonadota bacterium]|nr:paar repeat-containing protein [Pseudomonadota bacterium]
MTNRTLTSPSGRTLHHVASRRTTPAEDREAKELRILATRQKRLAENREYLKNANVRAYLAAIAAAEGGDYDLMYGGVRGKKNDRWRFSDFSTHPGPGIDGRTTAAGRYQINKANWKENGEKKMGLTDFSANTQDLIAVEAIRYAHAINDVITGDIEPAARKTSTVWAAIPKGPGIPNDAGQPYMHYESFLKAFKENGGVAR